MSMWGDEQRIAPGPAAYSVNGDGDDAIHEHVASKQDPEASDVPEMTIPMGAALVITAIVIAAVAFTVGMLVARKASNG